MYLRPCTRLFSSSQQLSKGLFVPDRPFHNFRAPKRSAGISEPYVVRIYRSTDIRAQKLQKVGWVVPGCCSVIHLIWPSIVHTYPKCPSYKTWLMYTFEWLLCWRKCSSGFLNILFSFLYFSVNCFLSKMYSQPSLPVSRFILTFLKGPLKYFLHRLVALRSV